MKRILISFLLLFSFAVMAQRRVGIQDYASVAALQGETITPSQNDKVYIKATQSLYTWDNSSTATEDGVNVIKQVNVTTGRFLLVGVSSSQLSGKLNATDTTTLLRKTTAAFLYQPKNNYGLLGSNNEWTESNAFGRNVTLGRTNQAGIINFARGSDGVSIAQVGFASPNSNGGDFIINSSGGSASINLSILGVTAAKIHGNGNLSVGTSTDAGFKLDVNGTARVSGNLSLSNSGDGIINLTNGNGLVIQNTQISSFRLLGFGNDIFFQNQGGTGMQFTSPGGGVLTGRVAFRTSQGVVIGENNIISNSAILEVQSTTKGFLPPRMTQAQRNAISSPASGLVVYCADCVRLDGGAGVLQTYNGTSWISAETSTHAATQTAGNSSTQIATTAFVTGAVTTLQNDVDTKTSFYTLAQIRAFSTNQVTRNPRVYMTDSGKEGFWYYDNADVTSTDNTGTIIITSSGARYKRIYDSAINTKWFINTGDTHTGQAITRAINLAISNLSTKTNETVVINTGVNTVNSSPIYTPVPLNKKLTIKGEANNIIDFYCVECEGGVFANSNTWTYTDSTYTHGTIEIDGLNFLGNRNPVSAYLSNNYGARPLLFRNMQRVEIRNCSFKNIYGTGLSVGVTASGVIENNLFYAVYARQPNALDATGDAIMLYAYCYDFLVKGNKIELRTGDYGRCGISVDDKSARCQVTGNLITGYERGIHVENCRNVTISSNTIYRSPIAIMSAINKYVTWESNIIDGKSPVKVHELAYPGLVFFLNDTLTVFRGNTVRNWHGLANTYLAKFWGTDLLIEDNVFEPQRSSAEIYGYYSNYRLVFRNNQVRGKANLVLDNTTSSTVTGNDFFGGWLQGQNSIDLTAIGNRIKPDIGSNTGNGFVLYGATRPYCSDNIFTNPVSYCIENTSTTNGVYEANTYLRTQASAAGYAYFFVSTTTPTGVRKSSTARHNVVRDFVNNETYYLGNATTASVY